MTQVLTSAPRLAVRKEAVPAPELGGDVIVRGLLLSEAFAVQAYRAQALRRVRQLAAERAAQAGQPQASDGPEGEGIGLPPGAAQPDADADLTAQLTVPELQQYGVYVAHLLHYAVTGVAGQPLYSPQEWEVAPQHYPDLVRRLQAVAERLSGFDTEATAKN